MGGSGLRVAGACGLICALHICSAATAYADSDSAPESASVEAGLGRLNHAHFHKRFHCTMFAVAERAAITASHCMRGVRPGSVHLLFGMDRMEWVLHTRPVSGRDLGNDLYLLCLGVDAPGILPVGREAPRIGENVTSTSYGAPKILQQTKTDCRVEEDDAHQFLLDCPVEEGASGAPIRNGAGEVVGIVSAKFGDKFIAAHFSADDVEGCF